MWIKKIVIKAEQTGTGEVEILREPDGTAKVVHVVDQPGTCMKRETLGFMRSNDDDETRYALASKTAIAICGRDKKRGGPNATNSMVHDVMHEIERLAGR